MTAVGGTLIVAIAINMLELGKTKIKVGNLLLAMFLPIALHSPGPVAGEPGVTQKRRLRAALFFGFCKDCRFSHRRARYFLLHRRKYPKSVSRGRGPWIPPRSVALHSSLSGVRNPRLRRFPRHPPGLCIRMLWLSHPTRRLAGRGPSVPTPLGVQTRRLEHQVQAPIGVVEVRQVSSAKGRGPPGVAGSVSRHTPVNRDWHQFCSPAKRGFLGGKSWRTTFVRWICPPMRVFAYFLARAESRSPSGETETRLPGRDPAIRRACRHPPEKGISSRGRSVESQKPQKKRGVFPEKRQTFHTNIPCNLTEVEVY